MTWTPKTPGERLAEEQEMARSRLMTPSDAPSRMAEMDARFDAHTKAVGQFLNELYAVMVDSCAEGTITVPEMKAALLAAAIRDRDRSARVEALEQALRKVAKETSGAPSMILMDGQPYKVIPTVLADQIEAVLADQGGDVDG